MALDAEVLEEVLVETLEEGAQPAPYPMGAHVVEHLDVVAVAIPAERTAAARGDVVTTVNSAVAPADRAPVQELERKETSELRTCWFGCLKALKPWVLDRGVQCRERRNLFPWLRIHCISSRRYLK